MFETPSSSRNARAVAIVMAAALTVALLGCSKAGVAPVLEDTRATEPDVPAPVAMGRQTWSGDWAIVVTRVQRKSALEEVTADKGNELLVVYVDIRNGGTDPGDVLASSFNLTDETGAELETVKVKSKEYLSDSPEVFKSGTKREVAVVYRVPKGGGPFIFRFWAPGRNAQAAIVAIR